MVQDAGIITVDRDTAILLGALNTCDREGVCHYPRSGPNALGAERAAAIEEDFISAIWAQ